jgi:hypothetical protein
VSRIRAVVPSLALALAFALAAWHPAAGNDVVPLRVTGGDSLTAAEDAAVRATLLRYLEAVQKRDWREAANHVDRESFLRAVEPMIEQVSPDPAGRGAARRMIFGVGTHDSLARRPLPELFAAMMIYALTADPTGFVLMEKARFSLLAARRVKDHVAVAYSLTVPADNDSLPPTVRVTAERLKKVGDEWKILIAQDPERGEVKR